MNYELSMTRKENYFINIFQNHDFINNFKHKRSIYTIAVLSTLLVSTSFSFGAVNAQLDIDDFMQQTQDNIQSTIENSENSNNNNNCDNNISIQSQTNENGKTTSTTRSTCDGEISTTSSTSNEGLGRTSDGNLNGTIVSSEFDQESGDIVSSIYGNWSLTTRNDGYKSFNASFTKQPIYYNSSETMIAQNETAPENSIVSNNLSTNTTSYKLSNFVGNSVQQQNEDITYSGKIDVSEEIHSNNAAISDETNNYRGIGVSISLVDNRVLFINFDTKSVISEEFTNAPIVGLVKR